MQSNSFLAISSKSSSTAISRIRPNLFLAVWGPPYIASRRTHRKHRFLYCCDGVFTAPLHDNGSYSIAARLFVLVGMCLLSSCLAVVVSYDFTIPAFRRHATITIITLILIVLATGGSKLNRFRNCSITPITNPQGQPQNLKPTTKTSSRVYQTYLRQWKVTILTPTQCNIAVREVPSLISVRKLVSFI
jgi:hypothetical protein